MKLSCIIVNYNMKYLPRLCIEALNKSEVDFPFEIIVVDNDSHDESVEYLEKMHKKGEITLVHAGSNLGYGKGNNLGARYAKGKYLLILNPDVSVEKNMLRTMVDYLEHHRDIGLLGPKLVYHNGQIQDSCRRFMKFSDLVLKRTFLRRLPMLKTRVASYLMEDYNHAEIQPVDFITGACIMLPRAVYEEIGGFDERYFLFMEDADLCRRLWLKGYKVVYLPEAQALHYHKRLSGGNIFWLLKQKVFWIHLSSAAKYFWKWRGQGNPRGR